VLRGFAERTKETYLACVSGLARHYGRSPEQLDTAAIQAYLLHLINERKLAYASVNQAVCALRFLFAVVLGQREFAFAIPMAKAPKRLPQILTRDEVGRLLAHGRDIRARSAAGIETGGGIHTLRHCFATHLLESGVDIHTIQRLLGHGHVSTTMRYFHLAQTHLTGTTSPLELLTPD
jgi:site-specific recombinase XerD